MKKIILIDGNNLLFRSYYATIYSGSIMKNSKGFPTNALYGFVNMLNKIIKEENPDGILVAIDKGKTFRHENFSFYKSNREETPEDLKIQIEKSRELMDAMNIKHLDIPGYEADDIIGTFSNMVNDEEVLIISSDRDLLQLINDKVSVKLLKRDSFVLLNNENFFENYNITPDKIIDLKGLEGDVSDNIPGVKGVGEKTAMKLLTEYKSIENIYVNIDKIKGKLKDTLLEYKEDAFVSKQLATIYKEVPIDVSISDLKFNGFNNEKLIRIYEELEFYSFLKNMNKDSKTENVQVIEDLNILNNNEKPLAIYLQLDNLNYHTSNILGMGIYNEDISGFIPLSVLKKQPDFLIKNIKYTYDLKKVLTALKYKDINISNVIFDTFIAANLLNYNVKEDIAYLANQFNYDVMFFEAIYKSKEINMDIVKNLSVLKAKFIYETQPKFLDELNKEECLDLFNKIEMPLITVLSDMEFTGIKVNSEVFNSMKKEIESKLEILQKEIYEISETKFNINSYKQLGEILFDKLNVPANKKRSTDREYLLKYKDNYPIIPKVLEYKMLSKIYGTYVVGLKNNIVNGKIHTIFTQTLTRTGRLSSTEPNLQNIPIKYEYGRLIRKAFVPNNDLFISFDYSQIELRIFAHFSKEQNLIEAFKNDKDIHTKTAMDLFHVSEKEVDSEMRRQAKAVNFGILYGISNFGLSENLDVDIDVAKLFINKYLETFPNIKKYTEEVIKEAYKNFYVKTIFNRKRNIEELKNKNYMVRQSGERMVLNTPIQGSSADIIKKAMVLIFDEMKKQNLKSKLILQIHDELMFDVVLEEQSKIEKIAIEIMENCCILDVPLKVEMSCGKNWYEVK